MSDTKYGNDEVADVLSITTGHTESRCFQRTNDVDAKSIEYQCKGSYINHGPDQC